MGLSATYLLGLLCFFVVQLIILPVSGQVAAKVGPGRSQPYPARAGVAVPAPHNHPPTPLLYEDFENATGYDLAGWGEDIFPPAVIDEDYTATVLYGTQSLFVDESNDDQCYVTNSFTASDHVWVAFLFRPTNVPDSANTGVIRLTDATDNCQLKFSLNSDGSSKEPRIQFECAGTAFQPGATMVVDTTYRVWIEYWNNDGANSFATLAFSTNGIRPTSGDNFISGTGTSTATQVSRVGIGRPGSENGSEVDFIMDHLLVDDEQINDWP